jgi:hypothetical protein
MDQVHVIRHKVLVEGQSVRLVARQLGVSRITVRKYLLVSAPKRVEGKSRARPVLERVRSRIEALLEQWGLRTTAKQRVTGSRLHRQLVEEGLAGQGRQVADLKAVAAHSCVLWPASIHRRLGVGRRWLVDRGACRAVSVVASSSCTVISIYTA